MCANVAQTGSLKLALFFMFEQSSQGLAVILLSALTIVYSAVALLFIYIKRKHWVIRYSQPLFCAMFLVGCAGLSCVAAMSLGDATTPQCFARPVAQHLLLTFTLSCLLVKVQIKYKLRLCNTCSGATAATSIVFSVSLWCTV
jgi:7 transmembrane sweet-taste receptor of 3 GCPR